MGKSTVTYDLRLVDVIYRGNNDILIRLAKRNLEHNKQEFDRYIQTIVDDGGNSLSSEKLSEHSNIDWIFLNSILIALFANYENLIFKLAKIVEGKISGDISIEDIKGHGYVEQYRKFMHLIGNIQSAEKSPIWEELEFYRLVRNKLAHEGGYLQKSSKGLLEDRKDFKYLIDNKVLLAGLRGHIRIREIYFLERFSQLTNDLLDKLRLDIESL